MGTENDRVNCPFYFKIGACRHGDRCSRLHTRPRTSPTLLLSNMYQRPDMVTLGMDPQVQAVDPRKIQKHFEEFYEDLFVELSRYGDIESLNICDNLADHLVGNVYIQFGEEKHAARALKSLTGKKFAGRPIIIEFSPVTDFREATCRKYEENTCNRGGYCDFMHLKKISRELRRRLFGTYRRRHSRSRSRSQSPYRRRGGQEESPHGGLCSGRRHDDRNRRPTSRSPGHRRGRSRSPPARRRNGSPGARESSAERRAKIEQWNREKEQSDPGDKGDKWNTGARESSAERRAKIKQFIRENVQSNPGDKGGKWNTNNKNDIWHHHDQLRKQQLQLPRPPLPRPPQDREWDP